MLFSTATFLSRFQTIKPRLQKLDTPHFCDASDKVRLLDNRIRPIAPGLKMVGLAHTVESRGDLLSVMKALKEAKKDEILIIDSGDSTKALAGEMFATEAKQKLLGGIVIDGACRDVDAIKFLGFPFYAKSICAQAGTKSLIGRTQIPVMCGGITVSPEDIICGDENGIVAINQQDIEEVLSLAEKIREKEELAIKKVKEGFTLLNMFNFDEHYEKIQRGETSTLTFSPPKIS